MTKIRKQAVYDYLTQIPKGKVVTYGTVARHLGNPKWARAVGNILHENPDGVRYPCYKVVSAAGRLSGNYAFGGQEQQKNRLQQDGIAVTGQQVDLSKYLWNEESP